MRHIFPGAFPPPPPEPSMPPGLVQLMEGLSRDVIVHNPNDVYKFCAEHMHKLLQLRDAQKPKPPPKTLEEKIAIAQAKVRERTKQRQRRSLVALKTAQDTTVPQDETKDEERESVEKDNITVDKLIPTVSELDFGNALIENQTENDKNYDENKTTINEDKEEMANVVENVKGQAVVDSNLGLDAETNNQAKEEVKAEVISDLEGFNDLPSAVDHNETIDLNGPTEDDPENNNLENDLNVEGKDLDIVKSDLLSENVNSGHIEKDNDIIEECTMTEITKDDNSYLNEKSDLVTDSVNDEEKSEIKVLTENEEKHTDFVTNEEPSLENDSLPNVNLANNGEKTDSTKEDTEAVSTDKGSNDVNNLSEENNVERNDITAITEENDVTNPNEQEVEDKLVLKTPDENIPEDKVELTSEGNNEPQSEVAINKALITAPVPENSNDTRDIVLRTDTDEDESYVNSMKFNAEYTDTSKESPKENKYGETMEKPYTNSAITDTPNETVHEESSFSELTNGTDKIDDDNGPQNTEMDLETAAVTIQKVFRSFLINRASTLDDVSNEESLDAPYLPDDIASDGRDDENNDGADFHNSVMNKERRGMGITRMDTVLQTVNEEKSLSLSDDSSTLSSAATVIQAHVRGFLVRNRMHSHKTTSTNSFVEGSSAASMEADNEQSKNKTVLNIHIVPEGAHYLSRDESMAMSVDLPLDGSPPTSSSLHSLGYDITERRKLLKREDAIQSISPPSNNSGNSDTTPNGNEFKLSNETFNEIPKDDQVVINDIMSGETTPTKSTTVETVLEVLKDEVVINSGENEYKMSSDENDVMTPFVTSEEKVASSAASDDMPRLLHSGEFHDLALPLPLPTKVSRSDSPVVREFKNVLGYFLIWNYSSS